MYLQELLNICLLVEQGCLDLLIENYLKRQTQLIYSNKYQYPFFLMGKQCSRQFCTSENIHQKAIIENYFIHLPKQQKILTKSNQKYVQTVQLNFQKIEKVQEKPILKSQNYQQQKFTAQEFQKSEQIEKSMDIQLFLQRFQQILKVYRDHDIDKAFNLMKSLQSLQQKIIGQQNLSSQDFLIKVKNVQYQKQRQNQQYFNRQILLKIREQYHDMAYYFNQSTKLPFQEKYNKKGIKISTRKDEKNIGFLVQTELHSSFQNLTIFFSNITFFPDIVPFCEKSVMLKSGGRNSKIGYGIIDFPMIAKREVYFELLAYNRIDSIREIFLYARSIHDKPQIKKVLGVETNINKDYVQLGFRYFVIRYQPIAQKVGNLKISANFDFGIDYLPEFIEDYIIGEFGKRFIKQILEVNEKFQGSKWQQNLKSNPELYQLVKKKISEYLNRKESI